MSRHPGSSARPVASASDQDEADLAQDRWPGAASRAGSGTARGVRPGRGGRTTRVATGLLVVVLAYFVLRGVAQLLLWVFRPELIGPDSWGGPSMAGVLVVHCGPGLVSALVLVWLARRRRR